MVLLPALLAAAACLSAVLWRALAGSRPAAPLRLGLCLIVRDQVDRVEGLLADLLALAGRLGACVEDVVLVDDGSSDGTAEVVRALGRRCAGLKVLCWPADAPCAASAVEAVQGVCAAPWLLLGRAVDALPDGGGAALLTRALQPPAARG